jgi:hypothetical protein
VGAAPPLEARPRASYSVRPGTGRAHGQARNLVRDILDARESRGDQLIAAERRDADGRVLNGRSEFLGRDRDLGQPVSGAE